MADLLRVGVVGAGIGAGYIAGFQEQPEVEVTALCTRTPTRLRPLAERYRIPHTYTDYESMLVQEPLDIVVIATPNHLHHSMTLAALDADKHVLCDKPLGMNTVQAREMVERAEQRGRKHFVPFTWRFLPAAAYMKEIIASGFVGQPYHINVRYFNRAWGDPHGPMRWQYDREQAGSGALGNLGSHVIHLIHWWFGDISRVSAVLKTAVKERLYPDGSGQAPIQVDDICEFLAELADGTPVVCDVSSVTWVPRTTFDVVVWGSEGGIILQDDWGEKDASTGRILATRKGDVVPTLVPIPSRLTGEFLDMPDYYTPFRACFSRMAAEFVKAIREDHPATPNFQDGLRVQEVMDAVLKSHAEQKWVSVA